MEPNQTPEVQSEEPVVETATTQTPVTTTATHKRRNTITSLVIVAMLLAGVVYVMEKQGRIDTNFFGGLSGAFSQRTAVATVNDTTITQGQLDVSVSQLNQAASLQGIDTTTAEAQAEIRAQALDVLINTELLTQAASARGIEVSSDDVSKRIATIESEVGGVDVLQARMAELGIDDKQLQSDVASEMVIQQLLDELFIEADITVSEEQILEVYDAAVASGAEVPALEEVRDQIELQIRTSQEQQIIDEFLAAQKAGATIEVAG